MNYRLLTPALEDLDRIDAWISENFGAAASAKAQRKLFEVFELLSRHQGMGVLRPEITSRPVRFFASDPNWVIYEPGSPMLIHRIFPALMDLERLAL